MAKASYGLGVGSLIGAYRIDGLIGEGGMGVVYAATHLRLDKRVALKVMSPRLATEEFRERFIRESRLAASIEHPNIIPIYYADEEDEILYLAMRYVDGFDLAQVLRQQGRLLLEETVDVLAPVAAALDAAHAARLVHRDIKPANVLIERTPHHVYLTDFGLAKAAGSSGFTRTGSFVGTPLYSAPEQIDGKPVDARTDVYSLGCLLFHCLTGHPPFLRENDVAVCHAHLTAPRPSVTALRPDLPMAVNGVVATAMARHPSDRYASAGDLVSALRIETESTVVAPAPLRASTLPPTDSGVPPTPPSDRPRTAIWRRTSLTVRLVVVGLLIIATAIVGGITAVLLLGHSGSPSVRTASSGRSAQAPAAQSAAESPSHTRTPSISSRISPYLSRINASQRTVTTRVSAIAPGLRSFARLRAAAGELESSIARAQEALSRMTATSVRDKHVLAAAAQALSAHVRYANLVRAMPRLPREFTKKEAQAIVTAARRSATSYARLANTDHSLVKVEMAVVTQARLLKVVPKPLVKPSPSGLARPKFPSAPSSAPPASRPPAQSRPTRTTTSTTPTFFG